jgi:HEAT repeat protein
MTNRLSALCLTAAVLIPALPAGAQEGSDEGAVYDEVSSLVSLLLSESETIRAKAAARLGKLHASYSVEALAAALDDPSRKVRLAVVGALGKIATQASAKADGCGKERR